MTDFMAIMAGLSWCCFTGREVCLPGLLPHGLCLRWEHHSLLQQVRTKMPNIARSDFNHDSISELTTSPSSTARLWPCPPTLSTHTRHLWRRPSKCYHPLSFFQFSYIPWNFCLVWILSKQIEWVATRKLWIFCWFNKQMHKHCLKLFSLSLCCWVGLPK